MMDICQKCGYEFPANTKHQRSPLLMKRIRELEATIERIKALPKHKRSGFHGNWIRFDELQQALQEQDNGA